LEAEHRLNVGLTKSAGHLDEAGFPALTGIG